MIGLTNLSAQSEPISTLSNVAISSASSSRNPKSVSKPSVPKKKQKLRLGVIHEENLKLCNKCHIKSTTQGRTRKRIRQLENGVSQRECHNCNKMMRSQSPQSTHIELETQKNAQTFIVDDAAEVQGPPLPVIIDNNRDLLSYNKKEESQANKAHEEAIIDLKHLAIKWETNKKRLSLLKNTIERYKYELERHRTCQYSDCDTTADEESQNSIGRQLTLAICGDFNWKQKNEAELAHLLAERSRLADDMKLRQEIVEDTKSALAAAKHKRSRYLGCLDASCEDIRTLWSKLENCEREHSFSFCGSLDNSVSNLATHTGEEVVEMPPEYLENTDTSANNSRSKSSAEVLDALKDNTASNISATIQESEYTSADKRGQGQVPSQPSETSEETDEPRHKLRSTRQRTAARLALESSSQICQVEASSKGSTSNLNLTERRNRQRLVVSAAEIRKNSMQLRSLENCGKIQDPHPCTQAFTPATALIPDTPRSSLNTCNPPLPNINPRISLSEQPSAYWVDGHTWQDETFFSPTYRSLVHPEKLVELDDKIINEYLIRLTRASNAPKNIAVVKTTDHIPIGHLNTLAIHSLIYIPIKYNTHWTLVVLYPPPSGESKGRTEFYDSHRYWIENNMTAEIISSFLKRRLGDEFNSGDWNIDLQQRSRSEYIEADSGLYLLANAKAVAFGLQMMELNSEIKSRAARRLLALELQKGVIAEGFCA